MPCLKNRYEVFLATFLYRFKNHTSKLLIWRHPFDTQILKFIVRDFHFQKCTLDLCHTWHDGWYWPKILLSTFSAFVFILEIKVANMLKFWVKAFQSTKFLNCMINKFYMLKKGACFNNVQLEKAQLNLYHHANLPCLHQVSVNLRISMRKIDGSSQIKQTHRLIFTFTGWRIPKTGFLVARHKFKTLILSRLKFSSKKKVKKSDDIDFT